MNPATEKQLATNFYFDRSFACESAKVLPGEFYFSVKPMLMVTVLGSCVATCLRDRVSGIGGMNHFMLPDVEADGDIGNPLSASMRYGVQTMRLLIDQLLDAGARRENLEAKLFGGGNVLRGFTTVDVGKSNADFARNFLQAESIRIVAEDLAGTYPRKVYFFPQTGKVLVKKLKQLNNYTLVKREQEYANRLRAITMGDETTL